MSKPDDGWIPLEEYSQMRNRVFDRFMEVLRQEDPRKDALWQAIADALVDVLLTLIMNLATDPRAMAEFTASRLNKAVDRILGGTKH